MNIAFHELFLSGKEIFVRSDFVISCHVHEKADCVLQIAFRLNVSLFLILNDNLNSFKDVFLSYHIRVFRKTDVVLQRKRMIAWDGRKFVDEQL